MRNEDKAGKLGTVVKERFIRGEPMLMPDRLHIAITGTPDNIVLVIKVLDKIGRTLSYFDCPPMRIGETIDLGNLRDALLKFKIV